MFVHVVGTSVWVAPAPADDTGRVHVVGVLDGACWYAVDVPAGTDPSDGAAVDLYAYHGRAGEDAWLAAGRAVQLVEWAADPPLLRPLRHADRAGGPRAGDDLPGVRPRRPSRAWRRR